MIKNLVNAAALVVVLGCLAAHAESKVSTPVAYTGMCDASAAVALTGNLFAVASDEDSVIRIYDCEQVGAPVQTADLSAFLDLNPKRPESDLEGATRVGDRVYWITSHGRNSNGKSRVSRERFFATQISANAQGVQLKMVGQPYAHLLEDLEHDPKLSRFNLALAATLEPKAPGALNIEGLSATPEGHLLIGFRNPIPGGRALVVPMLNPDEVVHGRSAEFGDPLLLDLGGMGVRDMQYWEGRYLIIAGSYDGKGASRLYEWRGGSSAPRRVKHARLKGLNPEAIVFYPNKGWSRIQVLSDDGKKLVAGTPCKERPPNERRFRSVWVFQEDNASAME